MTDEQKQLATAMIDELKKGIAALDEHAHENTALVTVRLTRPRLKQLIAALELAESWVAMHDFDPDTCVTDDEFAKMGVIERRYDEALTAYRDAKEAK